MPYCDTDVSAVEENRAPGLVLRECLSAAEAWGRRALLPGDVHVWHASTEATEFDRACALTLLSPDERTRMNRFHFDNDKDNFLFCRGMLRMLLASYLGAHPAELVFAYSDHGKPSLAGSSVRLNFNLSHSDGHLLIATSLARKIGVDIERVRRDLDVREIAERFFSSTENEAFRSMPVASRYDIFFSCWTRKEAFVKARGEGLSCPLDSFDVSIGPREDKVKLATRPDASEANRWELRSLNGVPGFAAAIVISQERASA